MSTTKQKILATSLRLFNSQGISQTSLRSIADGMDISVGNLQYHFKKREEIMNALYFELVEKIDQLMMPKTASENLLQDFFDISQTIFKTFYTYRFFLLDFNLIVSEHSVIKSHYKELMLRRERQFLGFVEVLVAHDLMRQEVLPNEYHKLYLRIQIISNFWVPSATLQSKNITKKVMLEYLEITNQTLFPYLTAAGKAQYLEMQNQ